MVHFNWTQLIPGVAHEHVHIATLLVSSLLLIGLAILGRIALGYGEAAFEPAKTFGLKAIFETLIEFIVGLVDMVIGEQARSLAPMFAAIFFFIWFNNLLGLIPGMTPATDNFNTTVAMGIFSFLIYNYLGFKEHGIGYLKHFLGPVIFMAPLMLVIEIVSHVVRPFSLGLRLQGNMVGDHTVLSIFLNLAPYGIPVIFYGLGIFVSTMQAFVFTMLTMIYVSMAIAHDH
jgi:F-type H+-transporting ATPase subunit a